MLNKLKKDSKGFTIIEVMIVLAIAGLIILVVLLAIPALQRNGRNTAIKNDAAAVAGGITEFASNNDGASITDAASQTATTAAGDGKAVLANANSGNQSSTAKIQGGTEVTFHPATTAKPAADKPDPGSLYVIVGKNCEQTPGKRSVSIYYSIETTSNSKQQCLDA